MTSVATESGLRKVNLRAAAGLIRGAASVWLGLAPLLVVVDLTKASARRLLADLKAKDVRQVSLIVSADSVGIYLLEGRP
jgi:hypothetical protein